MMEAGVQVRPATCKALSAEMSSQHYQGCDKAEFEETVVASCISEESTLLH